MKEFMKKTLIKDNFNEINFQKLDNFLDENIFKIGVLKFRKKNINYNRY